MAKKSQQITAINLKEIKDLIQLLKRNNVQEFDLEQEGIKIRIVTGVNSRATLDLMSPPPAMPNPTVDPSTTLPTPIPTENAAPPSMEENKESTIETVEEKRLITIKSPMVGTFYRAPSPEAPPYVEKGDEVQEDTVLCIVEAMKLMNEIKAETKGKVERILVENGQPVEYGQPLFLISPLLGPDNY